MYEGSILAMKGLEDFFFGLIMHDSIVIYIIIHERGDQGFN